jgi:hypothetical protein
MKSSKIELNKVFVYKGKKYKWVEKIKGAWKILCYENGNEVPPVEIPPEVLAGIADVEEVK